MTSEARHLLVRGASILVGAAVTLLVACSYLAPITGYGGRPVHDLAFNHGIHIEDADLECSDCHAPEGEAGVPAMPTLETCTDCHDEDEEDPDVVTYFGGLAKRPADALWTVFAPHSEEVIFEHANHAETSCTACHDDVGDSVATGAWAIPSMETCTDCHEAKAPDAVACAACHETIREDLPPLDHKLDWERRHADQARFGELDGMLEGKCGLCHERDSCLDCHRQVQPRNHNNFFRMRGHGLEAGMDREVCQTCHQPDMCIRCHENTAPMSHRASWGVSPRQEHCTGCHVPLSSEEGCALCHSGTPSHSRSPALPPNPAHVTANDDDCRTCHDSPTGIGHPDNGDSCRVCHQ